MLKSKMIFVTALLLASQCFAAPVFEEGKQYLYYTAVDPYTVYTGKVQAVTFNNYDTRITFEKLEAITDFPDCGGGVYGGTCKIKHYLEANKHDRSSMIDTLLTRPISYPVTQLIAIKLD